MRKIFVWAIRCIFLKWDPDFTKVTPKERLEIEEAERELERGETYSIDEINWD